MNLETLFTNNYEYLNTVATRITRRRDRGMAPDLLTSTYLTVYEKQAKGLEFPTNNDEFVKWFSKCMKNYFVWPNSDFNKAYKLDCHETERKIAYERNGYSQPEYSVRSEDNFRGEMNTNPNGIEGIIDEDAQKNIYLQCEQTNDFTKELLSISSCIGRVKALKYTELCDFKGTLPAHENVLFELYFEKELSTRDIAKLYSDSENSMSYCSVNKMVNNIKLKLKNHKWNTSNL